MAKRVSAQEREDRVMVAVWQQLNLRFSYSDMRYLEQHRESFRDAIRRALTE